MPHHADSDLDPARAGGSQRAHGVRLLPLSAPVSRRAAGQPFA